MPIIKKGFYRFAEYLSTPAELFETEKAIAQGYATWNSDEIKYRFLFKSAGLNLGNLVVYQANDEGWVDGKGLAGYDYTNKWSDSSWYDRVSETVHYTEPVLYTYLRGSGISSVDDQYVEKKWYSYDRYWHPNTVRDHQLIEIIEDVEVDDDFYLWFTHNTPRCLNGYWIFKNKITPPNKDIEETISCSCKASNITWGTLSKISVNTAGSIIYTFPSAPDPRVFGTENATTPVVYANNSWNFEEGGFGLERIYFDGPITDISEEFYQWFLANALPSNDYSHLKRNLYYWGKNVDTLDWTAVESISQKATTTPTNNLASKCNLWEYVDLSLDSYLPRVQSENQCWADRFRIYMDTSTSTPLWDFYISNEAYRMSISKNRDFTIPYAQSIKCVTSNLFRDNVFKNKNRPNTIPNIVLDQENKKIYFTHEPFDTSSWDTTKVQCTPKITLHVSKVWDSLDRTSTYRSPLYWEEHAQGLEKASFSILDLDLSARYDATERSCYITDLWELLDEGYYVLSVDVGCQVSGTTEDGQLFTYYTCLGWQECYSNYISLSLQYKFISGKYTFKSSLTKDILARADHIYTEKVNFTTNVSGTTKFKAISLSLNSAKDLKLKYALDSTAVENGTTVYDSAWQTNLYGNDILTLDFGKPQKVSPYFYDWLQENATNIPQKFTLSGAYLWDNLIDIIFSDKRLPQGYSFEEDVNFLLWEKGLHIQQIHKMRVGCAYQSMRPNNIPDKVITDAGYSIPWGPDWTAWECQQWVHMGSPFISFINTENEQIYNTDWYSWWDNSNIGLARIMYFETPQEVSYELYTFITDHAIPVDIRDYVTYTCGHIILREDLEEVLPTGDFSYIAEYPEITTPLLKDTPVWIVGLGRGEDFYEFAGIFGDPEHKDYAALIFAGIDEEKNTLKLVAAWSELYGWINWTWNIPAEELNSGTITSTWNKQTDPEKRGRIIDFGNEAKYIHKNVINLVRALEQPKLIYSTENFSVANNTKIKVHCNPVQETLKGRDSNYVLFKKQ